MTPQSDACQLRQQHMAVKDTNRAATKERDEEENGKGE